MFTIAGNHWISISWIIWYPSGGQRYKSARPNLQEDHNKDKARNKTAKLFHKELHEDVELLDALAHSLARVSQHQRNNAPRRKEEGNE